VLTGRKQESPHLDGGGRTGGRLERGGDGARAGGQEEEEDWDLGWTPPAVPEPRALRRGTLLVVGLVDSEEKVEERRKMVRRGGQHL
jgi:hypothetical protein